MVKRIFDKKAIKQTLQKSRLKSFVCKIHKHVNINSVGGKINRENKKNNKTKE